MGSHQPIRKVVTPEIPDKLYFRIGDVAKLCAVQAYVLRFWETEFPQLRPNKGGTGQRLYRRKDVEIALRIKTLLYDQGYTIAGARQVFKAEAEARANAAEAAPVALTMPQPEPQLIVSESALHEKNFAGASAGSALQGAALQGALPDLRRGQTVEALRTEMRSLVELLGRPAGRPGPAKVHAMRPRVVESRPAKPDQQDLF
jgi:DNA-binding transcriptional MerR regulator